VYYSQIDQDRYYIENIAKNKKNGIFLDIGANDGLYTSNTATLELEYNWTGICIEANPELIDILKTNRPNSRVVNKAVWKEKGNVDLEIPLVEMNGRKANLISRITGKESIDNRNKKYFKDHFQAQTKKVKVESDTITNILDEHLKLPCVIDYMSLDIEGAEMEALESIDFSNIDIRFMTVEHGDRKGYKRKFETFLKKFGYKLHRINKWDVEFIK
jgi:FkbM family methyltransferase